MSSVNNGCGASTKDEDPYTTDVDFRRFLSASGNEYSMQKFIKRKMWTIQWLRLEAHNTGSLCRSDSKWKVNIYFQSQSVWQEEISMLQHEKDAQSNSDKSMGRPSLTPASEHSVVKLYIDPWDFWHHPLILGHPWPIGWISRCRVSETSNSTAIRTMGSASTIKTSEFDEKTTI